MTDDSPESEAVRRLLAEVRHEEPMPADVADRMDRVLADLAAEQPAVASVPTTARVEPETDDAVVTPLSVHRRRRAGALLAAAAAIVVGGVVLAQHLPRETGVESAGSAATGGENFASDAGGSTTSDNPPTAGASRPQARKARLLDGRVVVRRATFAADARAARSLLANQDGKLLARPGAPCPAPSGRDQVVPATYQRAPALLVYHRADGSTQVVDLLVCGTGKPIRSVTLPAP